MGHKWWFGLFFGLSMMIWQSITWEISPLSFDFWPKYLNYDDLSGLFLDLAKHYFCDFFLKIDLPASSLFILGHNILSFFAIFFFFNPIWPLFFIIWTYLPSFFNIYKDFAKHSSIFLFILASSLNFLFLIALFC